jgi:hypothetical protein
MKSEAIKEFERMANAEARRLHPTMPHLATRKFRDDTANNLTKSIIAFLRLKGHQAERINCTGRPLDNTKVVTDVLGDFRRVGSVKWLPTSGQKGTADISAVIHGCAIKIEVKMKDRQSPDQKKYQEQVEMAGGKYWLIRSFQDFMNYYNG